MTERILQPTVEMKCGVCPHRVGPRSRARTGGRSFVLASLLLALLPACDTKQKEQPKPAPQSVAPGALLSVGSITVTQADLDLYLTEKRAAGTGDLSRSVALAELGRRAQLAQAALDAGLADDPLVRAEVARVLAGRLKDVQLVPELKAAAKPTDSRLREIYAENQSSFRTNEKRQVAVLWLNPNGNPGREQQYVEKLAAARDWYGQNGDLKSHPNQGFSVLSVDYSEHAPSRYKNGDVGWLESGGNMDSWSKAVAEIAFKLPAVGDVSEIVSRPEGVFLVRVMAERPAVLRTFESVADELARNEQQRLRQAAETKFQNTISEKYPVRGFN